MDVDPNYDPSDFLLQGIPHNRGPNPTHKVIQDDLEVSESDDETNMLKREPEEEDEDEGEGLWF